jgi:hypothetical protein
MLVSCWLLQAVVRDEGRMVQLSLCAGQRPCRLRNAPPSRRIGPGRSGSGQAISLFGGTDIVDFTFPGSIQVASCFFAVFEEIH